MSRPRNEQILLDYIKEEVSQRLKQSLHNHIYINLDKEEDPNQVKPPWEVDVKIVSSPTFPLPSDTTITDIYNREDLEKKLLILGLPGSGKTTTLLRLAQDLIIDAEENCKQPFPVLLNLSSWKDDNQSLKDWIIDELKLKYGVREDIGKEWLEKEKIIPFLDGLDELASDRQELCVKQINEFLKSLSDSHSIVVCSRTEEYQLYETQLKLNGSIIIQSLNLQQIQDYVSRTEGESLWNNIKDDPNLMELAKTPLLLNILVISSPEIYLSQWQKFKSSEERLSYLFDIYIIKMRDRSYNGKQPGQEKTKHWLGWLAHQLIEQKETEFFIENMQAYWLKTNNQKIFFDIIWMELYYVITLPLFLLFLFLFNPKSFVFVTNFASLSLVSWFSVLLSLSIVMPIVALIFKQLVRPVYWLMGKIDLGYSWQEVWKIKPGQKLVFSWQKAWSGMIFRVIRYGYLHVLVCITLGLQKGIILGGFYLFYTGVVAGFTGPEIELKKSQNQGIRRAVINAVILSVVTYPVNFLFLIVSAQFIFGFDINLNNVLMSCLCLGINTGIGWSGIHAIRHFSLRIILLLSGYTPWNYARFLDYATNRLFLQRVGGGYRFIHRLLQEHFAQMYREKRSTD